MLSCSRIASARQPEGLVDCRAAALRVFGSGEFSTLRGTDAPRCPMQLRMSAAGPGRYCSAGYLGGGHARQPLLSSHGRLRGQDRTERPGRKPARVLTEGELRRRSIRRNARGGATGKRARFASRRSSLRFSARIMRPGRRNAYRLVRPTTTRISSSRSRTVVRFRRGTSGRRSAIS